VGQLRRRIKDNPANPIDIPFKENVEWAIDFRSDALTDGRRMRTLNVIDHFNRKCKGIKIAVNLPSRAVIEYLEQRIDLYCKPQNISTDNGLEFRSHLFQKWMYSNNIEWSLIQKGKPQQNVITERFNRTYRQDALDANLFRNIESAVEITNIWVQEYNNDRPHQSLDYKTPTEYAA